MQIKKISAKSILDSRGKPTIEVSINGQKASSPSGTSAGKYETPCWHNSLDWNINAINVLKIDFEVSEFQDLKKVEQLIKKQFKLTDAKQFGGNALFALESAILKALAKYQKKQLWQIINPKTKALPTPLGNAIGGGLHSKMYKIHPVFQEFLLAPKGKTFAEKVRNMNRVYLSLKKTLKTSKINYEGALQCSLDEEKILQVLTKFKKFTNIGLDIAASTFCEDNLYKYNDKSLTTEVQVDYMNELISKYDLLYVEDPLQEEDFEGFSKIKRDKKHLVSGDDLTATHIQRLKRALKSKSINAMIIKPNQNGSLLELAEIFQICKKHKITTILSHRSGETLDNALADYAFAFQADFIKCGIATKYRQAKLNRLIEIEKSLK
jgi:enolase